MKLMHLPLLLLAITITGAQAQVTLFSEDLEGATPAITLNTTDVGSGTGANTWLINNIYTGGNGSAECLGFSLDYSIPASPGQPAGIASANGNYLHTASTEAAADGILCCSFGAADGFCTDPGNHFASMDTDVSTIGYSSVNCSFWWLCQGGTANYGEIYYSTNSGSTWTLITTPIGQYRNQPSWVQQTIDLAAFAQQGTLRLGFRFVNGTSLLGASDPGFALDELRITGQGTVPVSITTGVLGPVVLCAGSSVQVPYTIGGSFSVGNTFTVELSDAVSSFASPVVIGTLVSTNAGSIVCTIPLGTSPGSGYRVRVVSSAPSTIGSSNSVDITIGSAPSAGSDMEFTYCGGGEALLLFDLLEGDPDACGAWTAPNGIAFDGSFDPATDPAGDYTYTTNCLGPCPQDQATVTMVASTILGAGSDVEASICSDAPSFTPYAYIDGGSTAGQFFYQGQPFPLPDFNAPGVYALEYVVPGSLGCAGDTADLVFTVIAAPNAGSSLSLTVCVSDPPLPLLPLLEGAEPGGSWLGPSGIPFTGILIPATDVPGIYTYTAEGEAPCTDAVAFIALVIDPCSGIAEQNAGGPGLTWHELQGGSYRIVLGHAALVRAMEVHDAVGRCVMVAAITAQREQIDLDLSGMSTGTYSVLLRTDEGLSRCRLVHTSR